MAEARRPVPTLVGQAVFEEEIGLVVDLIGLAELEAGEERLHAQVILLVDHDAELLVGADDHGTAGAFRGVFAADEVALDEDLLLQRAELLQRGVVAIVHCGDGRHVVLDFAEDFQSLRFLGPAGERAVLEIAGETDATAYDDLVMRSVAAEPLAGLGHDVVERHVCNSCSSFWISSRRRAASSYFSLVTAFFSSVSSDLTRSAMA